jgi:hypothetical protein
MDGETRAELEAVKGRAKARETKRQRVLEAARAFVVESPGEAGMRADFDRLLAIIDEQERKRKAVIHAGFSEAHTAFLSLFGKDCPNCPNRGWFVDGPTDDPEQVQCEFCYCEPLSKFNITTKLEAAKVGGS